MIKAAELKMGDRIAVTDRQSRQVLSVEEYGGFVRVTFTSGEKRIFHPEVGVRLEEGS